MIRIFLAIFLILSFFSLNLFAGASDELLQTFGGQCFTKGALRDQALTQSQDLSSVIRDIRDDDKCKGIASTYDRFADKLGYFNGFSRAARISELEGTIQDLNSALVQEQTLGAGADATYVADLRESLSYSRLQLFNAQTK